jgi:hypothetical protein
LQQVIGEFDAYRLVPAKAKTQGGESPPFIEGDPHA